MNTLSRKPRTKTDSQAKTQALADVIKEPQKRLNANVAGSKYKRLLAKAIEDDTDVTALVNKWIDQYLTE